MQSRNRFWPKFLILLVWLETLFAGATLYVRREHLWGQEDVVALLKAMGIAALISLFGAGLWRSRRYRVLYLVSFFAVGFSGGYLDNALISLGAPVTALLIALLIYRAATGLDTSATR